MCNKHTKILSLPMEWCRRPGNFQKKYDKKLVDNVPDIEFCHSLRVNEPDRMYSLKTKKTAIDDFKQNTRDASRDMEVVFDCARIIRHDIATSSGIWTDRIPCLHRLGHHWMDRRQRQTNVLETIQKCKQQHSQSICSVRTDAGPFQ